MVTVKFHEAIFHEAKYMEMTEWRNLKNHLCTFSVNETLIFLARVRESETKNYQTHM